MPRRSSKANDRDFAAIARRAVEPTIGEHLDGMRLEDPIAAKSPAAVALGRLGGAKGRLARARVLSPAKRKVILHRGQHAPEGLIFVVLVFLFVPARIVLTR
jgi:hypothetical protein